MMNVLRQQRGEPIDSKSEASRWPTVLRPEDGWTLDFLHGMNAACWFLRYEGRLHEASHLRAMVVEAAERMGLPSEVGARFKLDRADLLIMMNEFDEAQRLLDDVRQNFGRDARGQPLLLRAEQYFQRLMAAKSPVAASTQTVR